MEQNERTENGERKEVNVSKMGRIDGEEREKKKKKREKKKEVFLSQAWLPYIGIIMMRPFFPMQASP